MAAAVRSTTQPHPHAKDEPHVQHVLPQHAARHLSSERIAFARSTARGVSAGHVLLSFVTSYQFAHLGTVPLLHADGARDELCH